MMRLTQIIACVGMGLFLAACAQNIKSDVARFHQLQSVSRGASFTIVPKNAEMNGSLEFEQYASLVRQKLVQEGYQPVNAANASDLVVALDYGVSDGDQVIRTRGAGLNGFGQFGGFGRGFHPFYGGAFGPWGGVGGGFGPDVYSYEVFTRDLKMEIYKPVGTATADKTVVFEGKVQSVGRDKRLPEVMPFLVEAMFAEFPGESGVTKEVVIEVPRS